MPVLSQYGFQIYDKEIGIELHKTSTALHNKDYRLHNTPIYYIKLKLNICFRYSAPKTKLALWAAAEK